MDHAAYVTALSGQRVARTTLAAATEFLEGARSAAVVHCVELIEQRVV